MFKIPLLIRSALTAALLLGAAGVLCGVDLDPAQVADDCRAEGEGEGLEGETLERFVKKCVLTLIEEIDLSATQESDAGETSR